MSVYEYSVTTSSGEEVSLGRYQGKVLLIVNTATGCGFTPQYKDLESMYAEHHEDGLEIIDIPCNQFAAPAMMSALSSSVGNVGRSGRPGPKVARRSPSIRTSFASRDSISGRSNGAAARWRR